MQYFCNCLNVCVRLRKDRNNGQDWKLLPRDFPEDVIEVDVNNISYNVPRLIKETYSGQWKFCTCMNCNSFVYVASTDSCRQETFINKNLLYDPVEINKLVTSESYSPSFKLILKQDEVSGVEIYATKLHDTAAEWFKEELKLTEERIKDFTDQQYCTLESLRLRALKDNALIIRRIEKLNEEKITFLNISDQEISIDSSPNLVIRNKTMKDEFINDLDQDSILFPMEGFENIKYSKEFSEIPSDATEDEDEEIKLPHLRKYSTSNLARSLPIPVPQYMQDSGFESKLNGSPPVPTDIAASIKALAKSVHGDSVFGELPRPRCRNNM